MNKDLIIKLIKDRLNAIEHLNKTRQIYYDLKTRESFNIYKDAQGEYHKVMSKYTDYDMMLWLESELESIGVDELLLYKDYILEMFIIRDKRNGNLARVETRRIKHVQFPKPLSKMSKTELKARKILTLTINNETMKE